ncbi:MAG: hypothetical protein JWO31_252 [Phycisphaerales bacterium]|nr:hypothetical protein [Phycisphaerales bacterium]
MTEWPEQLTRARRAYRAARFPGDLAADLLAPARAPRLRRALTVVGCLAAAAAIAVMVRHPAPDHLTAGPAAVAIVPPVTDPSRPAAAMAKWPDRMALSLPAAPFISATPPVLISLSRLPDDLTWLNLRADDAGQRWLQSLNRRGLGWPAGQRAAPPSGGSAPATQGSV